MNGQKKDTCKRKKETQADSSHNHSTQCESSVQFSHTNCLWPHGLQHARPPCPLPTPGVDSNSCPLSRWCHPTISSSVVPFSSGLLSFPASGYFHSMEMTKMLVCLASWIAEAPSMQMHHFYFFFSWKQFFLLLFFLYFCLFWEVPLDPEYWARKEYCPH